MNAKHPTKTKRLSLMNLLRQKVIESGLPYIELERRTGVLRQTLMAMAKGERPGIRAEASEKLMAYFGLEVVERERPAKRRAKGR